MHFTKSFDFGVRLTGKMKAAILLFGLLGIGSATAVEERRIAKRDRDIAALSTRLASIPADEEKPNLSQAFFQAMREQARERSAPSTNEDEPGLALDPVYGQKIIQSSPHSGHAPVDVAKRNEEYRSEHQRKLASFREAAGLGPSALRQFDIIVDTMNQEILRISAEHPATAEASELGYLKERRDKDEVLLRAQEKFDRLLGDKLESLPDAHKSIESFMSPEAEGLIIQVGENEVPGDTVAEVD